MRSIEVVALILALLQAPPPAPPAQAPADAIPACVFDRIDYTKPEAQLALCPEFGGAETLRDLAPKLRGTNEEETLRRIHEWVNAHFRYDATVFDRWRDLPTMLADSTYGGCADYAVVFGSLMRACGIPCVWVKTIDANWIRDFVAGRPEYRQYRGHVFLEVFTDGTWRLLEPGGLTLHDEYMPSMRHLPGLRWAYDKGGDPYRLILSVRWKEWLVQTERHFRGFDCTVLPMGKGREVAPPPLDVLILANSPIWEALGPKCQALGYRRIMSVNCDFETWLPRAKGGRLVITCVADTLVLPEAHRARYLPAPPEELARVRANKPAGILRRTLDDGTRVTLLYAPDDATMLRLVDTLELP